MWDHIIALITALAAAIAVILGAVNKAKINELHVSVDGRLTQLLEANSKSAHAEGVIQGTSDAKKG
jgi:hypothetical protein